MDVPRCEEKIPSEPREEEPARPVPAPVNKPDPQEHDSKENSGCTNLNWVRWHMPDHCAGNPDNKVEDQEGCRHFGVIGAESPIVICIHSIRVDLLLLLNSDYTDHPSVYQSMLISFTSLLLQGVSNEKQRRVNRALTEKRRIAAIRELCRTRLASRQAFSMRLRDSTVARPRRWDCVSTELQHQETHERGYDQGQK